VYFYLHTNLFLYSESSINGWEWQNPLPQGIILYDVWRGSSTAVFAVGYGGMMLHYDGTSYPTMEGGITDGGRACHRDV
jgi:hypothetical protein